MIQTLSNVPRWREFEAVEVTASIEQVARVCTSANEDSQNDSDWTLTLATCYDN